MNVYTSINYLSKYNRKNLTRLPVTSGIYADFIPRNILLLEELIIPRISKKTPHLWNPRVITMFISARHLSLSWAILTLNLLTWTKWWAPASARKWQMGFNSAFKGLIHLTPFRRISTRWILPLLSSLLLSLPRGLFQQFSTPNPLTIFLSFSYMPHVPTIWFSLIWSPE